MCALPAALRNGLGPPGFYGIRGLERGLAPDLLYSFLEPLACARVGLERTKPLPGYFPVSQPARTIRAARANYYLSRVLEFFPDRLATAKWRGRFKTRGLYHLEEARRQGRGVVLVCFHFGTYKLIPFWLRALGFPVIALLKGESKSRSRTKRMKDRRSPFPQMPTVFYSRDQLRQTVDHLSSGHVLLVAVDRETRQQIHLPLDDQWSFSMATGAMRLAARNHAELLPCWMTDEGRWNFRFEIGAPIPRPYRAGEEDLRRAGQHLLEIMLPLLRRHPEACEGYLLDRFRRNASIPVAQHSLA